MACPLLSRRSAEFSALVLLLSTLLGGAAGCASGASDSSSAAGASSAGAPSAAGAASAGSAGTPVLSGAGVGGGGAAGAPSGAGGAPSGGTSGSAGTVGSSAGTAGSGGVGGGAGSGGASGSAGSGGALANTSWVGTWAASPQSGGNAFKAQTLRQIVHTSISGTEARVQLSNAFGAQALNVSDVHIANRTTGASIDPASDKAVTFGGKAAFTIPAGALAVSDSIAFPVAALSDVAVSFYLPDQTQQLTFHQLGMTTNYYAAGNVSAAKDLAGAQSMGSYMLLANLDVKNAAALGAVVTLGASITDGYASTGGANLRWPNDLAKRFNASGPLVGVLNQGISGNALLHDGAGESAIKRFKRDVIDQPGVKWVIMSDDPINDLGATTNRPTGAQLIAGLQQIMLAAHQAKLAYFCATLTPFEGSGGWSADGEVARGQINAFIRGATSGCDGIVDQDTATHDPAQITKFLKKYNDGDWLHPNNLGLQAVADVVPLTLFK